MVNKRWLAVFISLETERSFFEIATILIGSRWKFRWTKITQAVEAAFETEFVLLSFYFQSTVARHSLYLVSIKKLRYVFQSLFWNTQNAFADIPASTICTQINFLLKIFYGYNRKCCLYGHLPSLYLCGYMQQKTRQTNVVSFLFV